MCVLIDWINNVLLFDDFSRRHRAILADLSLLPGVCPPGVGESRYGSQA
jgi:hypothetical protein